MDEDDFSFDVGNYVDDYDRYSDDDYSIYDDEDCLLDEAEDY